METIFQKYKDGLISRNEAYKLIGEKINLDPERIKTIYEKYFKPSQEQCSEVINGACANFENYMQFEDEAFSKFVFDMSKNEEKIREVKELDITL